MRLPRRLLAVGAFLILVLAGEVAGRWVVATVALADHAPRRSHGGGLDAWPAMVIGAKIGIALVLARLLWRLGRAHRVARGAECVARAFGQRSLRPRPTVGVSARAWLGSFSAMSVLYVLPSTSAEATAGCWPILTPWLHTQALPVFAVVAVVVAVLWRTVSRWLAELERYGECLRQLIRSSRAPTRLRWRPRSVVLAPRTLFGLAFECRPPPTPA